MARLLADRPNGEAPEAYYFMGKDNIVFHSEIWPAMLLGYDGKGERPQAGPRRAQPPHEVVSSEFLTMEGRKFSSSRAVVIYVRDFLSRYDADALRYYIPRPARDPDTDFTWAEFLRRNNDELVAGWGNLVNRAISMAAKNLGEIPAAKDLTAEDEALLAASRGAFAAVGDLLDRCRFKAALAEAMRVVAEANKYVSDHEPWKLAKTDPERMATVLHVTLQVVDDAKTLLTPFLPFSSEKVFHLLGGEGTWSGSRSWARWTPSTAALVPRADGRLRAGAGPLGVHADRAGPQAGAADADLQEAGPVDRRRGAGPARRRGGVARAHGRAGTHPAHEPAT